MGTYPIMICNPLWVESYPQNATCRLRVELSVGRSSEKGDDVPSAHDEFPSLQRFSCMSP